MDANHIFAIALDPSLIFQAQGLQADPWQRQVLLAQDRQILLNCCRQSGKSTVVAAQSLHTALFAPRALILLLSPSQRQSLELLRKVRDAYEALGCPIPTAGDAPSQGRMELVNGSRLIGLPSSEETIRGYSGVTLLLIDEAAQVPDELYNSVRPMLAVSQGRLVCLSTPFGQRGFFWREWHSGGPWRRVEITYRDCPRITGAFVAEEERAMGQAWVDQEYRCLFTAMHGLVYPDFDTCLVESWPGLGGQAVGGIDWGYHNPFAALWGILDRDDVLWIGWEHYAREKTLHELRAAVEGLAERSPGSPAPRQVTWYADPAGATEIGEFRAAGWKILKGCNDLRPGIAAVAARLRTGRLRVVRSACPNLVAESQLYRYPTAQEKAAIGENPIDEHNHALGALRYLIARLDQRFLARWRGQGQEEVPSSPEEAAPGSQGRPRPFHPYDDETLWTTY